MICTWSCPGHLSVCIGDSLWCSEEIVEKKSQIASLTGNFYLSMAVCRIVKTDVSLRYTLPVDEIIEQPRTQTNSHAQDPRADRGWLDGWCGLLDRWWHCLRSSEHLVSPYEQCTSSCSSFPGWTSGSISISEILAHVTVYMHSAGSHILTSAVVHVESVFEAECMLRVFLKLSACWECFYSWVHVESVSVAECMLRVFLKLSACWECFCSWVHVESVSEAECMLRVFL